MKIYKIANFDQERPNQSPKKHIRTLSMYDEDDLQKIEEMYLMMGEEIIPHILIDQAEEVEVWETQMRGHGMAKQYILSFIANNKVIKDIFVNRL